MTPKRLTGEGISCEKDQFLGRRVTGHLVHIRIPEALVGEKIRLEQYPCALVIGSDRWNRNRSQFRPSIIEKHQFVSGGTTDCKSATITEGHLFFSKVADWGPITANGRVEPP